MFTKKDPAATSSRVSERLALFPDSTRVENDSIRVAGHELADLAGKFGTPFYLYDRATLDASVAAYQSALASYPAPSGITYAGKAFLCRAIAEWADGQGLWVDCTGETETRLAAAAGITRERILVHGVNKSDADLQAGVQYAGTIVVDNLGELDRLAALIGEAQNKPQGMPDLWLRLLPGLAVETHHFHTQTGQHGSKFGMEPGEILEAAAFCRKNGLTLRGLHFHQGSNFRNPAPLVEAIELGLDLAGETGLDGEWHLSPGGGWGVAYHEDELPQPDINEYVHLITGSVIEGCKKRNLRPPWLHVEPGRSLIARAGIAVYCVGAVKRRGDRTWLLVDGGMTDNPRHALYGARYSALPVTGVGRELTERVHIGGPLCESGDILIEDLELPEIEAGELIAVPVSGAYQLSMSSNYNGARRPAVLWAEEGRVRLIQRRETIDDLLDRDLSIRV
ncbi:MAG: diaminopimelate decarboxylase [Bacteroidota bacterium]